MYDTAVGRWLSEDPILFEAGDTNLARFVGNGPTNAIDPSGLQEAPKPTWPLRPAKPEDYENINVRDLLSPEQKAVWDKYAPDYGDSLNFDKLQELVQHEREWARFKAEYADWRDYLYRKLVFSLRPSFLQQRIGPYDYFDEFFRGRTLSGMTEERFQELYETGCWGVLRIRMGAGFVIPMAEPGYRSFKSLASAWKYYDELVAAGKRPILFVFQVKNFAHKTPPKTLPGDEIDLTDISWDSSHFNYATVVFYHLMNFDRTITHTGIFWEWMSRGNRPDGKGLGVVKTEPLPPPGDSDGPWKFNFYCAGPLPDGAIGPRVITEIRPR